MECFAPSCENTERNVQLNVLSMYRYTHFKKPTKNRLSGCEPWKSRPYKLTSRRQQISLCCGPLSTPELHLLDGTFKILLRFYFLVRCQVPKEDVGLFSHLYLCICVFAWGKHGLFCLTNFVHGFLCVHFPFRKTMICFQTYACCGFVLQLRTVWICFVSGFVSHVCLLSFALQGDIVCFCIHAFLLCTSVGNLFVFGCWCA